MCGFEGTAGSAVDGLTPEKLCEIIFLNFGIFHRRATTTVHGGLESAGMKCRSGSMVTMWVSPPAFPSSNLGGGFLSFLNVDESKWFLMGCRLFFGLMKVQL